MVNLKEGLLVLDDTTLDRPYAKNIELVTRHWSGKHHQVVLGINPISLLWTDGTALIPTDFRVYDKPIGGKNKNEPRQSRGWPQPKDGAFSLTTFSSIAGTALWTTSSWCAPMAGGG